MNSFGALLERGECYRLGDINFAVTDIEQDTNSVKGAVISEGKIDQSVKIVMPVEKKIQPTKPCPDIKDRDILRSLGLMNKTVQQKLLSSSSSVRHSVRQAMVASHLRKEVHAALVSPSHCRRFSLGVCSFEHDLDIFNIDPKSKKSAFSYENENISNLDSLI